MDEKVREQILAIRDSGLTNMFDVPVVQRLAYERTSTNWSSTSRITGRNTCISS